MTRAPAIDEAPVHVDHRARMEILGAILLTIFLSALDQTIVGTALPRIVTDLSGNDLILGPALGGFLTDTISWHWVFLVNLPVGIVALAVLWRLLPSVRHPEAVRSIDYLGASVFAAALIPFLLGLTNKQTGEWTDPQVGGLMLIGGLMGALFIWVESRAAEPILPLSLFRNRTVTASIIATFLITFGFFGAVIFIPRWFQFVLGSSATASGYQMLPLMAGVMGSSILSGLIVARTGRYKWMTAGAMGLGTFGLFLLTGIRADTPVTTVWLWMFIAGVGIGPSFTVFTIVVQSAVAPRMLGTATSALTFFRQVGGSVGLALAGTIFGTSLANEIPRQLSAGGVPQPMVDRFASAGAAADANLTGVGVDLGQQILTSVPAAVRPSVEPFIGQIVDAIHQAFSLAIANAMWLAVAGAAGAAVVVVLLIPELELRQRPAAATETAPSQAIPVPE